DIRFKRTELTRQGPQDLQLVGQPRNALVGNRRLTVWISRVPDSRARARHAPSPLDAAIRFRRRSGGALVLAGRSAHQPPCGRAVFPAGRGRRVAFPLLARQCAADVDAFPAIFRVPGPTTPIAGATAAAGLSILRGGELPAALRP